VIKAAIGTLTCVVALMCAVPHAAYAAPQTAAVKTDSSIDSAIESRIRGDASLKKYDVDVSVKAGVATLTGTVATNAQRARAAQLAKAAGASSVENRITVDAKAATKGTAGKIEDQAKAGVDKTKEGADKAWDATKSGTAKAADKTKDIAEKAWQKTKDGWEIVSDKTVDVTKRAGAEITDAWITTAIKTKFMGDDGTRDSHITVDTDHHVVHLGGTVVSAAAHEKALDTVKHTDGVWRIVDNLTVRP
jgi:osmotically-inducible protein OsmY